MRPLLGRFDPGTTVRLVRAVSQGGPPMRPHEGREVVETATADETGSVTFTTEVPSASRSASRWDYWVIGRLHHHPLEFRASTAGPAETAAAQLPLQPDRPWTPVAPDRTPTSGGASVGEWSWGPKSP